MNLIKVLSALRLVEPIDTPPGPSLPAWGRVSIIMLFTIIGLTVGVASGNRTVGLIALATAIVCAQVAILFLEYLLAKRA